MIEINETRLLWLADNMPPTDHPQLSGSWMRNVQQEILSVCRPLVLDGAKPKGRTQQTFDQWIASLNGADAIPEDSAVFKYADAAKIPREFVELLWRKFESNYSGSRKRYRDWQKVFRLAVEGFWFDLYRCNRAGEYYLTTAGQAFQRSLGEA